MTVKVYIPYLNPDDIEVTYLNEALDDGVELIIGKDDPLPDDYHVLVNGRPSNELLEQSSNLKWLLIPFAGLPAVTRDTMRNYPQIDIHNIHHNAVITAETVFALMLSAAKFIIPIDREFRKYDWRSRYQENPSVLLEDKTALILGYGEIGRRLARMCKGFGMKVIATRRHPEKTDEHADEIHPPSALHDLLPRADVLFIALPATDETEGLLGEVELNLLPEKAILVNGGRANIVDESAFYDALKSGRLYAAASDVWYQYPKSVEARENTPPSAYPFHKLDSMVLSPHRAGHSLETEYRRMMAVAEMVNKMARGENLPNKVDLEAGY